MPPENVTSINTEYVAAIAYTLAGTWRGVGTGQCLTHLTGQGRIDNLRAMIENGSEIVHGASCATIVSKLIIFLIR
mgnify:CR=1 FL=1